MWTKLTMFSLEYIFGELKLEIFFHRKMKECKEMQKEVEKEMHAQVWLEYFY